MFRNATLKAEFAKNREVTERVFADMRQFMHDERLRANKMMGPVTRTLEGLVKTTERLSESHDDLIAESRAQRAALLKILDRMDGGGRPGEAPA